MTPARRAAETAQKNDYQAGYDAYNDQVRMDRTKSSEWQFGWLDAQDDAECHEDFW